MGVLVLALCCEWQCWCVDGRLCDSVCIVDWTKLVWRFSVFVVSTGMGMVKKLSLGVIVGVVVGVEAVCCSSSVDVGCGCCCCYCGCVGDGVWLLL